MSSVVKKSVYIAIILASSHLYADNYDFKPGLWENSSTIEIIEIDAPSEVKKIMREMFEAPRETKTTCFKSFASLLELEGEQKAQCEREVTRISANKVKVEELCTEIESTTKTVGEINLNGKSTNSEFETTSTDGPYKMKFKVVASGKYVGACD